MRAAFVDSSAVVAQALGEPAAKRVVRILSEAPLLLASTLLEAELRAALRREGVTENPERLLAGLRWVHPPRPLPGELRRVFAAGAPRGADAWHLACALFVAEPGEVDFVTLDGRQGEVARRLGFRVLPESTPQGGG